jgi:NitT/TauT family transport system ATP-binding protein
MISPQAQGTEADALDVRIEEKRYPGNERTVHAGLVFALPERQFACILGPSGCGKTTLLNLVSGLDRDFRGEIHRAGGPAAPLGYMFQTPRLMPWLSVRENVRLALPETAAGTGAAERLLAEMEMGGFLEAYPRALSGGMQRRVALARAFVAEPRLLLLDEPFLSLDAPAAERLRRLLLELWERRPTTVLFVTHDLREALSLADRVLFLSPRPARVVLDLPVTLPRPRDPEGAAIAALRRRLLDEHPDLLAGLLGGNGNGKGDAAS